MTDNEPMTDDDRPVAWGTWTEQLIAWCSDAGWGDAGERPFVTFHLDGNGWWDIGAYSVDDGSANTHSRDLEMAAKDAVERLTSHPERQLEADIDAAARAVSIVARCSSAEAREWIVSRRDG